VQSTPLQLFDCDEFTPFSAKFENNFGHFVRFRIAVLIRLTRPISPAIFRMHPKPSEKAELGSSKRQENCGQEDDQVGNPVNFCD
jgi:hypothetical protein